MWNLIEGLRERGKTVFLTTHYMDEAEILADTVAIINFGKIIAMGTPSQLISEYGGKKTLLVKKGGKPSYDLLYPILPDVKLQSDGDVLAALENRSDLTDAALALSGRKTRFEELMVKRPTLEDVFLNLTGKKVVEGELR
ncbi:MAG: hypothetical protein GWN33_02250 [Gammaproteobacteria bacterium]|nr:hypothetical protein [Gammaproteobacteria bacterium]